MAELADALDLGSSGLSRAGSSPVIRTTPAVSKSRIAGFSFHNLAARVYSEYLFGNVNPPG